MNHHSRKLSGLPHVYHAEDCALENQRKDTLAMIDDPRYRRMMGYTAADALAIKAELRG